jgi:L-threonylcarbamoyladenylate synthase
LIVDVRRAAELLRRGELVAYPTETVYGLGVDATSRPALARLRAAKGQEADRGLSVLVAEVAHLGRLAPDLPARARRIAERFWPGPVTLVVPEFDARLRAVATRRGVGFRCSPHPTAAALARAFGEPIVSTSCNRSGEEPCRTAAEVESVFGADLAVAVGDDSGGSPPSTVVAVLADGGLELLREGAIPFDRIEKEYDA